MSRAKTTGVHHGAVKVGIGQPPKTGVMGPTANKSGTVMAPHLTAGRTMGTSMGTMKKMKKVC